MGELLGACRLERHYINVSPSPKALFVATARWATLVKDGTVRHVLTCLWEIQPFPLLFCSLFPVFSPFLSSVFKAWEGWAGGWLQAGWQALGNRPNVLCNNFTHSLSHTCTHMHHSLTYSIISIYLSLRHTRILKCDFIWSIIWQRLCFCWHIFLSSSCVWLHSSSCEYAASLLQKGKNSPDYLCVFVTWHKWRQHGLHQHNPVSHGSYRHPCFCPWCQLFAFPTCGCDCTWQPVLW